MKRKRVKIHFGNLLFLLLIIGVLSYGTYYMYNKFKSDDVKESGNVNNKNENKLIKELKKLGYSDEEAQTIENNMKEEDILSLDKKYEKLDELVKVKYFHIENLSRYEKLLKNSDYEISEVVMRVNTSIDRDFYTDIKTIKDYDDLLVLVNKYYALPDDFVPKDLISVGDGQKMRREAGEAFLKLKEAINNDGLSLIAQSGYRSIDTQRSIYKNQIARKGSQEAADLVSARAGHSEHHTGLAIDVSHDGTLEKSFENTKQFKWLEENAHKYGFIMRYPDEKIYMTGYDYEPWHYRYVGVEIATLIRNENITFEEYYVKYKGLY
jgi:D-alanyl-D-alanine carboxypeptidase